MTESNEQLTPIETLLREAAAAEEAGVFERTSASPERLLRESWSDPVPLRATIGRKWIPVAAAIGIVAILWPFMYHVEFGSLREKVRLAHAEVAKESAHVASTMSGCLSGPDSKLRARCAASDFDADGDSDLADYRRFVLAYAPSGG